VRGGAIPVAAWGTLLLVLAIGNWVWDDKFVNGLAATFAVLAIYGTASLLAVRGGRKALRKGEPEPDSLPQALPQASSGAVFSAVGFASIVFGFTFGSFLIYFGGALLIFGLGRIAQELRAEKASAAEVSSPQSRRP
jgi:energy-converting hydrogenase Eha subunit H